jgi:very-short-patch-repair endonuclease
MSKTKEKKPHEDPKPWLVKYSDRMRRNLTFFERLLWRRLKKGVRDEPVWRQTVIHSFIVDFYIPSYRIAIELDGKQHDPEKDLQRDKQLFNQGITVLRFHNPKNDVEVNDIFSVVYAEICARQRRPNQEIPRNPHALSKHSRGFLGLSKGEEQEKPKNDKRSGNVEEKNIPNNFYNLPISSCEKLVRRARKIETGCQRQTFSSMEAAEHTCNAFKKLGVMLAIPEKCSRCGMIHLKEGS